MIPDLDGLIMMLRDRWQTPTGRDGDAKDPLTWEAAAAIEQLQAELDTVRADRQDLADRRGELAMQIVIAETERDSLRAELESANSESDFLSAELAACQRDAEAYRALKREWPLNLEPMERYIRDIAKTAARAQAGGK